MYSKLVIFFVVLLIVISIVLIIFFISRSHPACDINTTEFTDSKGTKWCIDNSPTRLDSILLANNCKSSSDCSPKEQCMIANIKGKNPYKDGICVNATDTACKGACKFNAETGGGSVANCHNKEIAVKLKNFAQGMLTNVAEPECWRWIINAQTVARTSAGALDSCMLQGGKTPYTRGPPACV